MKKVDAEVHPSFRTFVDQVCSSGTQAVSITSLKSLLADAGLPAETIDVLRSGAPTESGCGEGAPKFDKDDYRAVGEGDSCFTEALLQRRGAHRRDEHGERNKF